MTARRHPSLATLARGRPRRTPADRRRRRPRARHRAARRRPLRRRPSAACRRALAGYTAAEGARHPDVANALVELAATLEARDRPDAAAAALRRALAILRAPSDDPDLVRLRLQARIAVAGLDRARGRVRRRRPRLSGRAGGGAAPAAAPRSADRRRCSTTWASCARPQGRYAEAARFYRRAQPLCSAAIAQARATLEHNLGRHRARARPLRRGRAARAARGRAAGGGARDAATRPGRPTSRRWRRSSRRAAASTRRPPSTGARWRSSGATLGDAQPRVRAGRWPGWRPSSSSAGSSRAPGRSTRARCRSSGASSDATTPTSP